MKIVFSAALKKGPNAHAIKYYIESEFFVILCDQTPPFLQTADDTEQEPHYHYLKWLQMLCEMLSSGQPSITIIEH